MKSKNKFIMNWLSIIGTAFSLLCFQATSLAQTVEVRNITARQYQKRFNELTKDGYRPIKLSSKTLEVFDYTDGERPQLGYWATFQKQPNAPAWASQHGLTSDAYGQSFNHWTAQGYLPTDINVAYLDGQASYCVIFEKVVTPVDWQARHGLNFQAFREAHQTFTQQGFKLKIKTECVGKGGRIYAALWVKDKPKILLHTVPEAVQIQQIQTRSRFTKIKRE